MIARRALVALLAVEADAGAAARRAFGALLAVKADAGAAARLAMAALLAVEAESGATARIGVFAVVTRPRSKTFWILPTLRATPMSRCWLKLLLCL